MKSNGQLLTMWLGRIFANALAGGFTFAGVGALCGIVAGGLTGALQSGINGAYPGTFFGFAMGIASGVPGSLVHAVAAALAKPGEAPQPCKTLFARVSLGQIFGTVSAVSAFVCFEIIRAHWQNLPLSKIVLDDAFIFMFFAPALMIFGVVAAAIFKRD